MRTALIRSLVAATVAATGLLFLTATASASTGKEHDPVVSSPSGDVTILVTKLTHAQATSMLRSSGITWSSSGNCSDRNNPTCTSFEQVNLMTIQGAQTLKRASGCALNITGGTEVGHASGEFSHFNGYKLDYALNSCITNYIHNNFTSIGGNKWRSGSGNIYFFETNHWDVTYFNCGGC
jgi:hypothetical protein